MINNVFLPPEWYTQSCVQLTWPHGDTDWSAYLTEADRCFIDIAHYISEREKLIIVCQDIERVKKITKHLNLKNIIFSEVPNNDTWARDHGGITVFKNGRPVVLNFQFNGWGLKFPANFDNQITKELYAKGIFAKNVVFEDHLDFVLEGGSIETDGKGVLLTTTKCLLSKNRNEFLDEGEIESRLKHFFGVSKVLWLHYGFIEGDDTDSHIDTLARFCNEDTICYISCDNENDMHYEELCKMREELESFTNIDGKKYNLVPLPMAEPVYYNGERLPATYANFLIINDAVLCPVYNSKNDEEALSALKCLFPDRCIIPVDCSVLIRQHGSLHCVTMQYPKGVLYE